MYRIYVPGIYGKTASDFGAGSKKDYFQCFCIYYDLVCAINDYM